MKLWRIDTPKEKKEALEALGCDRGGAAIMAQKMEMLLFYIEGMSAGAANILKQDALSIGADLAVPSGVVHCRGERYDGVLMGTPRQLRRLAKKLARQPFGLAAIGERLKGFLSPRRFGLKIMGVVNANDDSFYPGSRFSADEAVAAIERMIEEGADIVDVGGVSSRPGSVGVGPEEELARVMPVLEAVRDAKLYERARFSIDSYTPAVIEAALKSGFSIVNDITGLGDPRVGELAKAYGATLVIMHMRGTPATMQKKPVYDNVILEVERFFEERLQRAESLGLGRESVWLDVGIGFGKRLEHNLALLKHLAHFRRFGCELLVGASRKSMIDAIVPTPVEARLPGTLAVHMEAVRRGASVVRCHDVAEHRQALAVMNAIEEGGMK
ncbi:dihydropteroate synthase [Hydrogenimonas sp.]